MTNSGAKILVVDDVAENRDLLIRRLKRLGFNELDQAANGVEALSAIEIKPYDLVLLDIMMPVLDGFGVLEALKKDGRLNTLPVVVVSALNEIDPIVRCIELGAEDFIFKPFNPTLLRARVHATLEKKALVDRTREELERKQLELNEARTLQLALTPPPLEARLRENPLSVDLVLEPAREVGGDLVDYALVGDDLLVLAIGDVSDKGAGAALMMARTHAMVRALVNRPDATDLFRAPERALGIVNAALAKDNARCMFVTFLLAILDVSAGRLAYVRAGHIPPFHYDNDTGTVARLDGLSGPPLGLRESVAYSAFTVEFVAGDRLLVITDGISEAQNPAGELYGEGKIERFITGCRQDGQRPLRRLISDIRAFESGRPASDDVAAILLTVEAPIVP
jgi:sigma-B regulation protein RsbU (phosphoserine phosphatase)